MVDSATLTTPDWYKMLATVRRQITLEELKLCEDSFSHLLRYHLEHGHVPDSVYDELGFDEDVDPNGNVVK